MDQVLCKIEHDTPLLYESETGSVQTSHNIDGTLDPYVSDTEIGKINLCLNLDS